MTTQRDARTFEDGPPKLAYLDEYPLLIPFAVVSLMALIGAGRPPYSYYVVLDSTVTAAAALLVAQAIIAKAWGWLPVAVAMVALWAPAGFIPVTRDVWVVLDIVLAITLMITGATIKVRPTWTELGQPRWQLPWAWWKSALIAVAVAFFLYSGAIQPDWAGRPIE